jgi:hypothetical protein
VTLAMWVVMRCDILSTRILVTIVDFCLTCIGFISGRACAGFATV